MLQWIARPRRDEGAVAVLYAIVLAGVIMPIFALGTTTLVRSTTNGELQRASDAGALAGAAAIPFGDVNFARNFVAATAGGRQTDRRLRDLGLAYDGEDPLDVACSDVALPNAEDGHGLGSRYATAVSCYPSYVADPDLLTQVEDCASGLASLPLPVPAPGLPGLPATPDLSPLLPALLYPGVRVEMSWHVTGPFDRIISDAGATETTTSVARRRFKNMVVVPEVGLPTGTTINLNPYVGDVRNAAVNAMGATERILASNPLTAPCSSVLDGAQDDILDAIDPPAGGPDARQIIRDAIDTNSPLVVARVISGVEGLDIPYLDFVPVCAEQVGPDYVGHLGDFGSCAIDGPGAFRASLRRAQ
jgi:hypothetical protein